MRKAPLLWASLLGLATVAASSARAEELTPPAADAATTPPPRSEPSTASPPGETPPAPTTAEESSVAASVAEAASEPAASGDEEDPLAAELAEELRAMGGAAKTPPPPVLAPTPQPLSGGVASARGLSNLLNPAISANALLLAGATTRDPRGPTLTGNEMTTGFHLQEVELRLSAIVDPFFRSDLTITGNLDGVGVEEATLTTLELPRVTVRAGQLYAGLGRHNQLHTHAYPFLTAPLPWRALFGDEGLKDVGVSVEVLLPLPFYTELVAQAFRGEWDIFAGGVVDDPATAIDETVPDRRRDEDFAYLAHLKTLFELGESTTLELGATYLGGRNGFAEATHVIAGDLTVKWRPYDAERYTGLDWTTEYVWVDREGSGGKPEGGAYSGLRYQLEQRWWGQARGAILGMPRGGAGRVYRVEALVAFVPSEFSALRLQYALEAPEIPGAPLTHEVFIQAIYSIGPHPPHSY